MYHQSFDIIGIIKISEITRVESQLVWGNINVDKKNSRVQVYENTEASVGCTKLILTHHYLNFTATREPYTGRLQLVWSLKKKNRKLLR